MHNRIPADSLIIFDVVLPYNTQHGSNPFQEEGKQVLLIHCRESEDKWETEDFMIDISLDRRQDMENVAWA